MRRGILSTRQENVRVFVSVGLSFEARQQLVDAVDRIRKDVPDGIQWANPDGLHLTLKFLGNIPATAVAPLLECLHAIAREATPFTLRLDGLGMFPNRRKPRVLWAGVNGDLDALSGLQQVSEASINTLGHPPEQRPFRPHITLGRPRRSVSDAQLSRIGQAVFTLAPPRPVTWLVDSIEVMQSELHPSGARYTVLGSVPLNSPPVPPVGSPLPEREGYLGDGKVRETL